MDKFLEKLAGIKANAESISGLDAAKAFKVGVSAGELLDRAAILEAASAKEVEDAQNAYTEAKKNFDQIKQAKHDIEEVIKLVEERVTAEVSEEE